MSAFLAIRDAAMGVLSAPPALAGGNIRGGRLVPVAKETQQAIEITLRRSNANEQLLEQGLLQWSTQIGLELYARTTGSDGETAIDALLAAVFARFAAAAPPTGAIGWSLNPAVAWAIDEADQTITQASVSLNVTHFTNLDLTAVAV
jgi:hypothetical protein